MVHINIIDNAIYIIINYTHYIVMKVITFQNSHLEFYSYWKNLIENGINKMLIIPRLENNTRVQLTSNKSITRHLIYRAHHEDVIFIILPT